MPTSGKRRNARLRIFFGEVQILRGRGGGATGRECKYVKRNGIKLKENVKNDGNKLKNNGKSFGIKLKLNIKEME